MIPSDAAQVSPSKVQEIFPLVIERMVKRTVQRLSQNPYQSAEHVSAQQLSESPRQSMECVSQTSGDCLDQSMEVSVTKSEASSARGQYSCRANGDVGSATSNKAIEDLQNQVAALRDELRDLKVGICAKLDAVAAALPVTESANTTATATQDSINISTIANSARSTATQKSHMSIAGPMASEALVSSQAHTKGQTGPPSCSASTANESTRAGGEYTA